MAIQTFVADTILTAAQMNALQANDYNQTVSTKTASYTLVAADKGTKIVMNSASATTITVNTSLFSAGDTLTILNIAAGVCTVTAGTATVSTTGSLALAQNGGGTLYFTSAGVSVFQADGVTAAAGGLTLISTVTSTTAATIIFDGVFTATYTNYLILHTLKASAGITLNGNLRLAGVTVAGTAYSRQRTKSYSTTVTGDASTSGSTWYGPPLATNYSGHRWEIFGPAIAQSTGAINMGGDGVATLDMVTSSGYMATATAYDGIIYTTSSGTVTGTSSVYGYSK